MPRPPRGQIYDFSDSTDPVGISSYDNNLLDTLIGGSGNDFLRFSGHDVVTGGAGADVFGFYTDFNDNKNADRFPQLVATIRDFSLEEGDEIGAGYYGNNQKPGLEDITAVYLEEKDKTIIKVDNNGEIDRIRLLGGDFTDDIASIFNWL